LGGELAVYHGLPPSLHLFFGSLASQIRFPATSGGPGQHDSLESLAAGQLWIEFASAPERRDGSGDGDGKKLRGAASPG